ncbi:hypothetical protein CHU98_g11189 [Xylaria longipes]|nr:hypothetical protein CHU98_g11189 [Xylaria longipes]
MRLAFVVDDQKITELEAALGTDPSSVRSLLSGALLGRVRARYPDVLDHLLAKRCIRDVLHLFSAEHERRVTAYILARALDPRTKPARLHVVQQSFVIGGPVALAGAFYATIDSHRNVQKRETLNYLSHVDDFTRVELFRRASYFPCSPSMGSWLARLLDRLDLDSRDLAALLLCLGQDILPTTLFGRARVPSRTWGEDGEVVETPTSVPLLIRNRQRFDNAMQDLGKVGLASTDGDNINVRGSFRAHLGNWGQSLQRKEEAVRLVSHSFPKHKTHHANEYISLCHQLLPAFRHAITYLPGITTSQSSMYQATEACLSASRFFDEAWKREAIGLGHLASAHSELSRCAVAASTCPALFERVQQEEIMYTRAKAYRFEGQFAAARALLVDLVGRQSHLTEKATIHLTAVDCELGQVGQAMATLEAHLEQVHLRPKECRDRARGRLELALANAQLMQMLFQVKDQRLSWFSHPALHESYLRCLANLPVHAPGINTVLSHISIAAALAILAHLRGDLDTALAEWNLTLGLARGRGLLGSYIDLLVAYSTLDLLLRPGVAEVADWENKVWTLAAQTGRQYHFLGLGTTWPDILGSWQEDRGRGRLRTGTLL